MNYIYTPYMDEIVIPQVEQKINFESMDKSSEFYDPKIFSSFETYMKAYGSGISSIIIQSEPGKENMIKDYVVSIFPFASATTYEELKDEELSNRNMKLASYIRYEVVIFMIVFLLYFLFSKKFKAKSRKLKLNLVHYKISDIKTIIFIEILIKSCVVFTPLSILMVITDNISIFSIVGTVFYIIIFVLFSYYSDIKYLQRNQYNGK